MQRSLHGIAAGGIAAAVWALQQPIDKRVFGTAYDDVELLGKLVTRRRGWRGAGFAFHIVNGSFFGVVYAHVKPLVPGPAPIRGLTATLIENFGLRPLVRLADRLHPARKELEKLQGNRRALVAATWRHALFGILLGRLEA